MSNSEESVSFDQLHQTVALVMFSGAIVAAMPNARNGRRSLLMGDARLGPDRNDFQRPAEKKKTRAQKTGAHLATVCVKKKKRGLPFFACGKIPDTHWHKKRQNAVRRRAGLCDRESRPRDHPPAADFLSFWLFKKIKLKRVLRSRNKFKCTVYLARIVGIAKGFFRQAEDAMA